MMVIKKSMFVMGAAAMLLSSCNGIMGGIYDDADVAAGSDFGFIVSGSSSKAGTIYIDATDYTVWNYIDFEDMTVRTVSVFDPAPVKWDIAVHRYDVKTNGATAYVAAETDIDGGLSVSGEPVSDVFTSDVIVTDMSTMMDGYLSYVESDYNPLVSQWLDVDKSTMPPIYTLSGKVYVIRLADGRSAAVSLENFMDDAGIKGFMTIRYKYPLNI